MLKVVKPLTLTWIVSFTLWAFLFYSPPSLAQHLVTLTYNLEQMVTDAERIFVGKVIDVQEIDIAAAGGTIPVTVYTFEVDEALKGAIGNTLTIQQVSHRSLIGKALPRYKSGSVVMLFLHADSQIGLTSPVGAEQGAFEVKMDGNVKVSLRNGRGNRGLLERSARIEGILQAESPRVRRALKTAKEALPYSEFRGLVLKLLKP